MRSLALIFVITTAVIVGAMFTLNANAAPQDAGTWTVMDSGIMAHTPDMAGSGFSYAVTRGPKGKSAVTIFFQHTTPRADNYVKPFKKITTEFDNGSTWTAGYSEFIRSDWSTSFVQYDARASDLFIKDLSDNRTMTVVLHDYDGSTMTQYYSLSGFSAAFLSLNTRK